MALYPDVTREGAHIIQKDHMITIRQKSINIARNVLLAALRDNLAIHAKEYLEALTDYRAFIICKLDAARLKAEDAAIEDVPSIVVQFSPPQDHREDYADAIEMLDYSTDDVINLDQESFKAYIKNEWAWSHSFKSLAASYKSLG